MKAFDIFVVHMLKLCSSSSFNECHISRIMICKNIFDKFQNTFNWYISITQYAGICRNWPIWLLLAYKLAVLFFCM